MSGQDPDNIPVGQSSPGIHQFVITPDNNNDLPAVARSIRVNDTTTVTVRFLAYGDTVPQTWTIVGPDTIGMYVKRVYVTGTNAASLLGLS